MSRIIAEATAKKPLAGQVAIITGASRGIGREVALAYAAAGTLFFSLFPFLFVFVLPCPDPELCAVSVWYYVLCGMCCVECAMWNVLCGKAAR